MQGTPPKLRDARRQTRVWWRWMEDYPERHLTFSDDLLPAILGIIQYYEGVTQDVPVLNLWESSLHEDLAWMRIGRGSERFTIRAPDRNMPSWSPFSYDQEIEFGFWYRDNDEGSAEYCVDVIEHEVLCEGTPYLSRVRSSALVIDAPLQELYLSGATDVPDCSPPYFNVDHEEVDPAKHALPWRCAVQWDKEVYRTPQAWLCLLLRRKKTEGIGLGGETFLVLEAVRPSTYRRVGNGSLGRKRNAEPAI